MTQGINIQPPPILPPGVPDVTPPMQGFDQDCFQMDGATTGRSEDYLFIPSAEVSMPPAGLNIVRATRFCGTSLMDAISPVVVTAPRGQFQIIFNSDTAFNGGELGFKFDYTIT